MESIVQAKDRQAAEANKNASILLEELDLEKVIHFPLWIHELLIPAATRFIPCSFMYVLTFCILAARRKQKISACCKAREKKGKAAKEERGAAKKTRGNWG